MALQDRSEEQIPQNHSNIVSLQPKYTPAPPYNQQFPPPANNEKTFPQPASSAPCQSSPSSRTFLLKRDGLASRNSIIVDTSTQTPLYKVSIHYLRKPQVTIISATDPTEIIATATFHWTSTHVDLVIRSHPLTLSSRGCFKSGHTYRSPAFNATTLKWTGRVLLSLTGDTMCLDERDLPVARFESSSMSYMEGGRLEVSGEAVKRGEMAVEELVVTGVAVVEYRHFHVRNIAGGGGGSY